MKESKKMAMVYSTIDNRINNIMEYERVILEALTVEYIGEKYRNFTSDDIWVLLEDYIDGHPDADNLCRSMDQILEFRKIRKELSALKAEIRALD